MAELALLSRPGSHSPWRDHGAAAAEQGSAEVRLQQTVQRVARLAAALPGDAVSAHLSLDGPPGRSATPLQAASDASAGRVAAAQHDTQQGPSQQARTDRRTTVSTTIGTHPRWPQLAAGLGAQDPGPAPLPPAGAGTPAARSVVAVPLLDTAADEPVGVLTFTRPVSGPFDPTWLARALAYADIATSILLGLCESESHRQHTHQLETALTSRAVIDQAKGVLMQRRGCDAETAFAILATASQGANINRRDTSRMVVDGTRPAGAAGDHQTARQGG